ncbi:response regulator [Acidaminobacter sp. JC074]|uniref:HD domain-containing phosphohydrolase n=1 Tax=Acidaminobacter sp. JC074 TaxID=2530199 RepID=UPI001F0E9FA0|nr:HD domain-containing phosphohydrolase [Acidaminobacter sp. JC074]MCH4886847.1 response regulator [Acidaminobacter sp. JC074]
MRQTILIVDDTEENIDILVDVLSDEYKLMVALEGNRALDLVKHNQPDLILLDVMMPGLDGYEVCKRLKESSLSKRIPVVFLTALSDDHDEKYGIDLGAVDYVKKPFNPMIVKSRVQNIMQAKKYQDRLEELVLERTIKIEITKDVIIKAMGRLAEFRDPETGAHIQRTQHYLLSLAEYLSKDPFYADELSQPVIEALFKSAPLHDIGKIAIPDSILRKPGPLSIEEFNVMKEHALHGKNAIAALEEDLPGELFIKFAGEIAYTHHEKWDGSGYPRGLKGSNIPISGRIMALADVYDALTTERVYKPAFSHEHAKDIILKGRGVHFDPDVVDAFLALEEKFLEIKDQYID